MKSIAVRWWCKYAHSSLLGAVCAAIEFIFQCAPSTYCSSLAVIFILMVWVQISHCHLVVVILDIPRDVTQHLSHRGHGETAGRWLLRAMKFSCCPICLPMV